MIITVELFTLLDNTLNFKFAPELFWIAIIQVLIKCNILEQAKFFTTETSTVSSKREPFKLSFVISCKNN